MQYFNRNKIISQAGQALAANGGTLASYLCSPHFLSRILIFKGQRAPGVEHYFPQRKYNKGV